MLESIRTGTINRTDEHSLDISGKGINVSRVLVSLGNSVIHLTHLGGDLSAFFAAKAREEGFILKAVSTPSPIRICVTLLDKHAETTTEIIEDGYQVDKHAEGKIRRACQKLVPRCHTVIISGTKTKGYSTGLYPDIVRLAKKEGKRVICDFRGEDLINSIECNPDIIKPNVTEFAQTFFPACDHNARDQGLISLIKEKIRFLACEKHITSVLTDGPQTIWYTENGCVKELTPPETKPVNTTGCGDAFTAGMAHALCGSDNISAAVRMGTGCAVKNALRMRPGVIA